MSVCQESCSRTCLDAKICRARSTVVDRNVPFGSFLSAACARDEPDAVDTPRGLPPFRVPGSAGPAAAEGSLMGRNSLKFFILLRCSRGCSRSMYSSGSSVRRPTSNAASDGEYSRETSSEVRGSVSSNVRCPDCGLPCGICCCCCCRSSSFGKLISCGVQIPETNWSTKLGRFGSRTMVSVEEATCGPPPPPLLLGTGWLEFKSRRMKPSMGLARRSSMWSRKYPGSLASSIRDAR